MQRVPVTDRRGRVQSSTVTVAVLGQGSAAPSGPWSRRDPGDFRLEWYSGSGSGGQHRNKHMNSARIVHLPTGTVRTAQTRSRENSRQSAMEALLAELDRRAAEEGGARENGDRRSQLGSGERSDKRRTYRFQDGRVTDHATGASAPCAAVMAGGFPLLWR